jgi:hypothetical protein
MILGRCTYFIVVKVSLNVSVQHSLETVLDVLNALTDENILIEAGQAERLLLLVDRSSHFSQICFSYCMVKTKNLFYVTSGVLGELFHQSIFRLF